MSKNNFGIKSTFDAFVALNEILEEEKPSLKKKLKNKKLKEGISVDLRSDAELEAAKKIRDEKKDDTTLEVIDVDADAVDQIQNNDSYVGKMLLQCVSCRATRFMDIDDLKQDENAKDLYNLEDECPHCHHKGSGYYLVGQVGKTPEQEEEPTVDNDEASNDEAVFDNTEDVENEEVEEETPEETPTEEKPEDKHEEEEKDFTETDSEDDTDDLDLASLGDEFNVDDIVSDDTEDEDEEDKTKKESLKEDKNNGFYRVEYHRILPSNIFRNYDQHDYMYVFAKNGGYAEQYVASHINQAMIDKVEEVKFSDIPDDEKIADSIAWWDSNSIHYLYEDMNKDLEEDLDMATFEGSIANLIDTFTIEDHPVNVKLLNKNGSELGIYSSDDLPFTIKSQMMDTFNTEDNFLELNVTKEGDGTTVNDLFNCYRPDEDNQTTFLVTDVDTEEENEYEELPDLLENYGDYYIDGALGLRTLNIYIADGDLETEVEPLDDEEIEELGKENRKAKVTEESLIEEIIKSYPRLKLGRINNPLSEEYFIAESIRLNEDLDLVYNNFVKYSNDKKLIEHFKSYTGYEDEVDKFLKEHNISKEKYDKIINEPVNKVVKSKDRVIENKEAEKLFASVTGRAQLGEAINKLVKANEKYRIAKSLREGYRYDIFVNSTCKLNEGLFDLDPVDDSNVEVLDGEVVDRETPEANTTQLVPEGMSEEDIEIVNKIDRIAGDICDAIEEVYNIPAREKKPYVAADIIRDLQLVGGEVLADDLEDTPWNNLTREMYNQFNGFYDALDDLVSFITGQRVTTSQAERLRQAIESLDGPQFTTEAIRDNIASPRFLEAVRRGYVPYVSPQEISTNRNNRNRFLEQCDDEITEDVNQKLVDMDGDVEDPNFNLASFAKTTVTESAKDLQEFGNAEDVEKRLDELEYLKTQRELNDEEQEEYDYCLQLLGKEYEEEYPIDLEEFDSAINEYFAESDDVLGYASKKIKRDGNDFIVEGLVENWDTSKPITFIIKKNEGKDNYTVSNDLFEDKFTLDL